MGAFYKTASPETVDFMYQLPQEQLIAAMKVNEQNIDTQYQQFAVLNDQLLKLKSLAADQPEVKKYLDEMEEKVTSLTKTLQNDPMAWKKQMPLVRDLGQQIHKDFTRGKAAHWQSQYDAFQAADTKEKARIGLPIDKGGITPEQYELWKNATLGGFKGSKFDDAAGTGKSIGIENVYGNQNIPEKIQKFMKDQIANSDSHFNVHTGQWVYTDKTTHESMTQEEVIRNATNLAMADPDIMGYARQMQSWNPNFGYSEKDASGQEQFIAPYTVDDKGRMSVNNKSFMAPALRGLAGVYGFDKITKDGTVPGANPYTLKQMDINAAQELEKLKDKLAHPLDMAAIVTESSMQMFEPEGAVAGMYQILKDYKNISNPTAEQTTRYNNALENIKAIQAGAQKLLGIDAKKYEDIKPALLLMTQGIGKHSITETGFANLDPVSKAILDAAKGKGYKAEEEALMKIADRKNAMFAIVDKYASKKGDLIKLFQDNNTIKYSTMNINPTTQLGKVQMAITKALESSKDFNMMGVDGNPITLKLDGTSWRGGETIINSMSQLSPYLIPLNTSYVDDNTIVEYAVNTKALADNNLKIEFGNGFDYHNGNLKVKFKNKGKTQQVEKYVADNYSIPADAVKEFYTIATDPVAGSIASQLSQIPYASTDGISLDYSNPLPHTISLGNQVTAKVRMGSDGNFGYNDMTITDWDGNVIPASQFGSNFPGGATLADKSTLTTYLTDIAKALGAYKAQIQTSKNK